MPSAFSADSAASSCSLRSAWRVEMLTVGCSEPARHMRSARLSV